MHRREFVKRSRSSRPRGEEEPRRETGEKTALLATFLPLFLFSFLRFSFRKLLAVLTSNVHASGFVERFGWSVNFSARPPLPPILFSASWRRLFQRFSLFLSPSLSPSPSPCVTRDDTIVWCSLQQRVFDFSSFNGCNRE